MCGIHAVRIIGMNIPMPKFVDAHSPGRDSIGEHSHGWILPT
jgi:hypothetical protein